MGEEERAEKESKMKGDQRMPIGKGGPRQEEIRSSNLERQCYGREYKNGKILRKEENSERIMNFGAIELEQA